MGAMRAHAKTLFFSKQIPPSEFATSLSPTPSYELYNYCRTTYAVDRIKPIAEVIDPLE
jgi:hypothetical protein